MKLLGWDDSLTNFNNFYMQCFPLPPSNKSLGQQLSFITTLEFKQFLILFKSECLTIYKCMFIFWKAECVFRVKFSLSFRKW